MYLQDIVHDYGIGLNTIFISTKNNPQLLLIVLAKIINTEDPHTHKNFFLPSLILIFPGKFCSIQYMCSVTVIVGSAFNK